MCEAFPTSGSVVNSRKQTAFLTDSANYAAFSDNAIASFQFNTALLTVGIYVFTPEGVELLWWSAGSVTRFASPVMCSLQVVPEPSACAGSWRSNPERGLLPLAGDWCGRQDLNRPQKAVPARLQFVMQHTIAQKRTDGQ
jgi:hypothetical protein